MAGLAPNGTAQASVDVGPDGHHPLPHEPALREFVEHSTWAAEETDGWGIKTRRVALASFTGCVALVLAACSGGGSPGNSAGATTQTTASAGGSGICTKMSRDDVQALLPATISSVSSSIGDCVFHEPDGSDLTVTLYSNDPDMKYYNTLSTSSDSALMGVGDVAYWNEAVRGRTPPYISAHKGNETCVIQSNEPPDTTLKATVTTNTGLLTVDDSDALAYARLMGKVCNDAFAAT